MIHAVCIRIIGLTCLLIFLSEIVIGQEYRRSENPTLHYGLDDAYLPFEYVEKGKIKGFQIDLMNALSRTMDFEVKYHSGSWDEIWSSFRSTDSVQVVAMFYSDERAKIAEFSEPHAIVSHHIIRRTGDEAIRDLEDINGMTIAIEGSNLLKEEILRTNLEVNIVEMNSEIEAMESLGEGLFDAAIISQYQANVFIDGQKVKKIKPSGPLVFPLRLCYAVKKGNTQLPIIIDRGMKILKNTGDYSRIYLKWFQTDQKKSFLEKHWMWLLLIIVTLAIGFWLWIRSLEALVKRKSNQLNIELEKNLTLEKQIDLKNAVLEKKNQELDSFTYKSSHDLISPLKSIRGLTYVAGLESSNSNQLLYLDRIAQTISRLEGFMEKILDYSAIEKNRKELENVDPVHLVKEIYETLKYSEHAEKINFEVEAPENFRMISDPVKLIVVFNNLISNCIKYHNYSQPNPLIKVIFETKEGLNMINISDNGKGIDSDGLLKINAIFSGSLNESNRLNSGLFFVNDTINKLGGNIELQSQIGCGTNLRIRLPLN